MKRKIVLLCISFIFLLGLSGCDATGANEEIDEEGYVEVVVELSEEPMDPIATYEQTEEVIAELNENSDLYLDMLSFADQYAGMRNMITADEIRQALRDESPPGSFAIRDESNEERLGKGQFGLFPHDTDDIRLMQLIWDVSGSFHVFGIDVESCIKEAEAILLQRGFEEQEPHPHFQSENFINRHNKRMRIFANSLVSVSFFVVADGTEILEILVTVDNPFERRYSSEENIGESDETD